MNLKTGSSVSLFSTIKCKEEKKKKGQEVNMNLFDFTYCGNYNRQIQNLARISPEKWSFGQSGDNGILKGYLENTFRRLYEEGKSTGRERICPFSYRTL